jgi:phosphoribosyl-ATP pyrophosphohydrolase/phosphoribosyl-AMP cyclohydrolase
MSELGGVLDELEALIASRKADAPEGSYTALLLGGKADKALKKVGEEATEVVIAACKHDRDQLRYESADLLYHLLVVLAREGVSLDEVAAELRQRRK